MVSTSKTRHKSNRSWRPFKAKVGLALGGGGARGIAHIGVLRALEEKGTRLRCIAGTSVGALIAALYAFGKDLDHIEKLIAGLRFDRVSSFRPQRYGFMSNRAVYDIIMMELGDVRIEQAHIPLAIVCTDISSGATVNFFQGSVAKAVQASTCFPGLYAPVEYQNSLLVDGALTENIPVSAVKALGANFVVGVSCHDFSYYHKPEGIFDVLGNCFDIVVDNATRMQVREVDYMVKLDLRHMSRFRTTGKDEAILQGYQKTLEMFKYPLWYWWFHPIVAYCRPIFYDILQLIKDAVKKPNFRRPFDDKL